MESKTTNENTKIQADANNENYGDFQGKISFIFRIVYTTINLCLAESNAQNKNNLIKQFNELFKNEENEMTKTLNKFILVDLYISLGEINQAENPSIRDCISCLGKFLNNKITFGQLFDKTTDNLNKLIDLVKKNGSKPASIQIINTFYEYTNDHLNRLIKVKKVFEPKKCEEGEIKREKDNLSQNIQYKKKINSLIQQLKNKEIELNNLNEKIINESLDKNTYKEDNQFLLNKIKEMDKKIDSLNLQFEKKWADNEKQMNLQFEKKWADNEKQMSMQFEKKWAEKEKQMNLQFEKKMG
jgi:hypothetical protein